MATMAISNFHRMLYLIRAMTRARGTVANLRSRYVTARMEMAVVTPNSASVSINQANDRLRTSQNHALRVIAENSHISPTGKTALAKRGQL